MHGRAATGVVRCVVDAIRAARLNDNAFCCWIFRRTKRALPVIELLVCAPLFVAEVKAYGDTDDPDGGGTATQRHRTGLCGEEVQRQLGGPVPREGVIDDGSLASATTSRSRPRTEIRSTRGGPTRTLSRNETWVAAWETACRGVAHHLRAIRIR